MTVDYQSKGSGAGIQDFINHTVDFAASDAAMTDEEIAKVDGGVVLLPMTAGEIVLAYNLPGVTELKLPRDVYPDIFLGNITSWNDPRIAAANPGRDAARHADHRGPPLRQQRHHLRVHQAPRRRSARRSRHGPGAGTTVQWPSTGQHREGAQERRRDRDDQADARVRSATSSTATPSSPSAPIAMLQNAAGNYVAPGGEGGAVGAGRAPSSTGRRSARLDHRTRRRRRLPDRDLHLDAVLQGAGPGQGRGAHATWSSTA